MSALEDDFDFDFYRALQRGDDPADGPQVLAALLQRPPWHRPGSVPWTCGRGLDPTFERITGVQGNVLHLQELRQPSAAE